ncbi:MAG: tetratricopeptide repeat protein [Phycisphaerae bacterium]
MIDPSNTLSPTASQHYRILKETADCHAALGQPERAEDFYRQAAAIQPELPDAHVGLAVLYLQTERHEESEQAFRAAVQLEPRCAEALAGLAMIHQRNGNATAAFEMYLKCLELDTDNLVALLGLFQTSCEMGSFAKIIHYLEIYLERHPGDTSVLFCLATLQAREGQLEQAHSRLLDVLALEPDKAEAIELLQQVEDALPATLPAGGVRR